MFLESLAESKWFNVGKKKQDDYKTTSFGDMTNVISWRYRVKNKISVIVMARLLLAI